jgi:acyl CoA:acetate/3-ketoacid CoA transferase beta subunit
MTLSRQQLCERLLREVDLGACRWVLGPLRTAFDEAPASRGRADPARPLAPGEQADTAIVEASEISEHGEVVLAASAAPAGARSELDAALSRARRLWAVLAPYRADECLPDGSASCLVRQCRAPTIGRRVGRIFSPWAVLDVTPEGLVVRELAPHLSARQLQQQVEPTLKIPSDVAEIATEVLVKRT